MQISPLAPLAAPSTPDAAPAQPLTFAVPEALHARFVDAAARARRDVAQWVAEHPGASDAAFGAFISSQVGAPPADTDGDIALSKAALATRDRERNAQAIWIDGDGINDAWRGAYATFDQAAGGQAATGRELLKATRDSALAASLQIKSKYRRERPYQAHPEQLPLVPGITHANGFSYPSGHATHAFTTAGVLAALNPAQAGAAFRLAEQVAYSRVYAAAHFSSDVAMGAYLGSAYAAYATRQR